MRVRLSVALLIALGVLPRDPTATAATPQGDEETQSASPAGGRELVPVPTLGGKQFWADQFFFHQWRIQRNALTGECRLLDQRDARHAWGTCERCRAELEAIRQRKRLPPMQGRAVIVLHGLVRTRESMQKLCEYLEQEGGYSVLNVSYPSTRLDIAAHAANLARIVDSLEGIEEINFVAHSMGNVVIRHYLGDQTDPARGRRPDARIRRIVMLAPPNQRSLAALAFSENTLFKTINGTPGQQLGRDWAELQPKLATPACEFGIVAGGRGDGDGFNPVLPGDDDGTVTVAGTRLSGASDFLLLPVLHTCFPEDPRVIESALRFLKHGYFISPEQRQPL